MKNCFIIQASSRDAKLDTKLFIEVFIEANKERINREKASFQVIFI